MQLALIYNWHEFDVRVSPTLTPLTPLTINFQTNQIMKSVFLSLVFQQNCSHLNNLIGGSLICKSVITPNLYQTIKSMFQTTNQ